MKAKLWRISETGRRRASVIALCAVLALVLGTVTAFAVGAATEETLGELFRLENGKASYSTDGGQTWNEGAPANGGIHYSLDEGKTWSDGLSPEGSGENTLVASGQIPDGTESSYDLAVKEVDGVLQYSTDGGKTWSTDVPSGVEVAEDGSIWASFGNGPDAGAKMSLIKVEDGIAYYSTGSDETWIEGLPSGNDIRYSLDEGKTWNNGLPPADSGGQSLVAIGTPPAEGEANGFITRNEKGVMSYSTDGGKTWSDTAPEGYKTTINPDGSVSVGK